MVPRAVHRATAAALALALALCGAVPAGAGPSPCEPRAGSWCDAVGALCSSRAGSGGRTACGVRIADEWYFDEGDYCTGCTYAFYVLVECGREVHLPLSDMEGARVTVTEVLTGAPVTLRCVNDSARGMPPVVFRCPGPAGAAGLGPAFDVTSAGTVAWGFPSCRNASDLTCSDVPQGGGPIPTVSPGELQTMDCVITAPAGTCGLYRVEIESGGYEWKLFANCDGSPSPHFRIFHDCSEALAAFRPLPELALAAASASGSCPDVMVEVDVQDIGCAAVPGPVTVRFASACVPPEVVDVLVPGPIDAGGSVRVAVPFRVTCDGAIVVTVDPDDAVAECTEVAPGTLAGCGSVEGGSSLVVPVDCCAADLVPVASGGAGCAGQAVVLDGSGTSAAGCSSPEYRWLRPDGSVLRDWSPDPRASAPVTCPGPAVHVLEVRCGGEPCVATAEAVVTCEAAAAAGEARDLLLARRGTALDLRWTAAPGATGHRVLRGGLDVLWLARGYDHRADDADGRGACWVEGVRATDPDDGARDGRGSYYLVVGVDACGRDGSAGAGWARGPWPRPPRVPTASCP